MMRNIHIFLLLILGFISNAQVGIGTTTPTQQLDVRGSVAITKEVYINPLDYAANPSGFTIVGTDPQSLPINGKVMEVENLYTPLTIQPYTISNIYRDDLTDLDLNISTDKFFITIANFEAIPASGNNGIYINPLTPINRGYFVFNTFQANGTWHVKIGYPTLNTQNTFDRYTYKFDVILYSKRFFKDLGELNFNLNGSNSGSAVSAPTGI